MAQPNIVRRDKASSHPRERGRFYNGIITSVRSDGRVHVRIPSLNVSYGPIMPLNTTDTSRYVKDDTVLCGFTDENNSQLVIFGSISPKFDVFATAENGISIYENTGSRDAAIPSPTEGRTVYILDTDELQIYNGTEWITVVDTGNSENITAATLVATSASIGTLTVTGASTLNVLGSTNLTASTSIGNVSSTEIGYLDGVTSAIQTQINSKSPTSSPTFTGTVTIPTLSVTSNATIGGNLTVNGTTTTINSTVTTIDDPIITLGGDAAPSSDDNKDRGIEFRYHSGTAASVGFMGYDDSTGRFTFLTGATNSSEVFSGTLGTIDIASIIARPASTQDGIILQGRAGGTSDYAITLTPGTLTASRTITLPDTAGTVVTTGDSGTVTSTMIANDTIVNADINSAAAIADTKLATISTAGKVSNAATTATSANTANAIVARDASGNFSAGTITATLSGAAPASQISGQNGMWTSATRPGPYKLYRNDHDSAYNIQATWDGSSLWYLRGYLNDSYHAPCRVGYADSAGNSSTVAGLSVHSGRNNGANQIVRTDGNGYLQTGYINSDSGYNENNNSSPDRVWGSNAGGDSYLRAYRTSALSVSYASSAGSAGSAGSSSYSYYVYSLNPYAGDAYTGNVVKFQWDQPYIRFWIDSTNVFSARNGSAITGTTSKTFVINHPLKEDNYLVHACAEGPTSDVFYRGVGQLENGFCVIQLPEYFESLTEADGRTVMLTPIYEQISDEELLPEQPLLKHSPSANLAATKIENGKFEVAMCGGYIVPDQKFYWRVDAIRKNTIFDVEPRKDSVSVSGDGPYTYIQN